MTLNFPQLIQEKSVLLLDGAMGTNLIAHGLSIDHSCERWNLERPELIQNIHRSYVEAGSDIILTNTFGGNPIRLNEDGLANQTVEINSCAVQLAKSASQNRALVFGDIGPTGVPIDPIGPLSYKKAQELYGCQARALIEAGVEGICIETMIYLNEARAAIDAVLNLSTLPILVSFAFHQQDSVYQTLDGYSVTDCVKTLQSMDISAIGINCLTDLAPYSQLLKLMASETDLPLIAQPNAGLPKITDNQVSYPNSINVFMNHVPEIIQSGAKLIGGCCGTTPDYISQIRQWIHSN